LGRVKRILQIGVGHLIREKWQETFRIDELHKRAAVVEPERPHHTVPSVLRVHLRHLTGVQRFEVVWEQQLDGRRRRAVRRRAVSKKRLRLQSKLQSYTVICRGVA
jgi:hypothetical protein